MLISLKIKKVILLFATTWINLEGIMLSKISQLEKESKTKKKKKKTQKSTKNLHHLSYTRNLKKSRIQSSKE